MAPAAFARSCVAVKIVALLAERAAIGHPQIDKASALGMGAFLAVHISPTSAGFLRGLPVLSLQRKGQHFAHGLVAG